MNKIYKVIYSKVKQCYIVVSELAKSHVKSAHGSNGQQKAALTAAVLLALGAFSFVGMPSAQADESILNNDFIGANDYYWYYDEKEKNEANKWKTYQYKGTDAFNNRSRHDLPNYKGAGAKLPGAITAGLSAQAGQQTVTIGDRNAGASSGSVFIGEHSGYDDGGKNSPTGASNNYVTSVGFQSDATGWGSIAIGSNAIAENSKMTSDSVTKVGNYNTTGTVRDDTYSIEAKPAIEGASVALGYNAHSKDGNIAIGADSEATATDSAGSYLSVGNDNLKRRITNVADGKGNTDVATVGQMNKAIESIGTTGWNLSTNGNSSSTTTITSGKTVDFSPAVDGKNGTTDHKNVNISKDGSNVKIGLNKDIVLGEATNGNGGSLNVYSDSTEASNLGNRVSIDGSTVSVNYGKEDGTSGTKRGVVLGVGEDYDNNAQGYIAFNNIDAKGTIGSTYLHSATDAPNDLKGRLVYSNAIDGTEYIANLDDGITFTGDVQKDVPEDYTQTPTKLNTTLNITGGAATEKGLTSGNIGVVSTPAAENADGTKTQASKLEIKLNKDLKGITSITSQTTDGTTTSGATITLGTNGTTISGGDVNVSSHKITGLKDGAADTDAATVGQMKTAIGDAKTKYYSVQEGLQSGGFSTNENNDGASSALAGLAAGYETGTAGIASTVVGSYSGVIGSSWLQGAAAVSVGTVNVNNNTDTSKLYSGVANSIVGQANTTTNSNAAIIYGAGNTVTDSYRPIDKDKAWAILGNVSDPTKLSKAMQDAVKDSGGQVMVMGGVNNVESAYMSQVVGVGNTVKGNQVKNTEGEWATDTSDTAIKDYDSEKSSQYNYVDGFNNEVINGKHDYIIGANNKLDGDSYDDNNAKPIKRSNKSNVVIGDNHALTGKKNNVIIGSADTEGTLTRASDAVIIGHNANATSDTGADNAVAIGLSATAGGGNAVTIGVNTSAGENSITIGSESSAMSGQNIAIGRYAKVKGYKVTKAVALGQKAEAQVTDGVAIGSNSIATVAGNSVEGYDPTTGQYSTDGTATWKATKAAVSIGTADGKVTRQINGVAAGTNDTDAVNVAQIKKLASINASNIGANLQYGADGTTAATDTDKTKNKEAWATAIGTGTVTKDDDGSKQMVTGSTVYNEVRPSEDGTYVKMSQTTGENLLNLDSQVKTNTDTLSDVNSRSVKYDTKTENGKTVVDNTKITLAGEGGTTITNLKAGVNDSDAATVGQLNSKIAGVTYTAGNGIAMDSTAKIISAKAGNGITVDTNGINAKAGTGITVNANGINVNTGKHLSVNASGQVDVDDNGEVAANDVNLVTGKTVYDALHGGLDNITVGKDGQNGKDGSIGIAGQNGKDGYTMTIIKTEQGAAGVDGKDGITRVIYQDKDGSKKHTIATLDDGLKFKGDNSTVITKKLDEQLNIIGGASTKLTESNIGVNNVDGNLKVQLAQDLTGITSISGSTDDKGAKITLDTTDKNISLNGGSIKDVASNLTKDGKIINGSDNNAASISDVQILVQQGVDNGYTNGDGITIQKDGTSGKNVISVNQGDGLKFDNGKLAVKTGDGLTVDEATKALKIKTSDRNLKVDKNGIGLNNVITIGTAGTDAHPITIDSTKGEVSGLNNTSWDSKADYSASTKAATESQVAAAVKDAIKQAGDNDTHVEAGSYAVDNQHQISMNLVDKNNTNKGTVTITDVAKASEMGDVSQLNKGVQNADGKTTTVVDAINNVNENVNSVDRKVGDLNYFKQNDGKTHTVTNGTSITKAIGDLDSAVQNATEQAGKHTIVSTKDTNLDVKNIAKDGEAANYQIALNQDLNVNTVTAKTVTTDNLTVNKSATIGGVTIANKTISGLDDTKIEKDSPNATNAVNERTIYNELRPTSDGSYIKTTNTTAQNLTSLDTQVRATHDLINSDGKTIKIGGSDAATKIDVSGKDSTSRVITGVKTDANDSTSAASVGYVNDMNAANTQQIYHDMNSAYSHVENDISRAAAGSNALAALHPMQEFDPDDKAQYALGYGHYRNSNAGAVGVFYQPDENSLFSLGASFGNGDAGINAGVTFKFGPGGSGHHALTKTQMAKVIDAQSKEIDALKKDNADKDKRIDALEQKVNEILAKVEKDKA